MSAMFSSARGLISALLLALLVGCGRSDSRELATPVTAQAVPVAPADAPAPAPPATAASGATAPIKAGETLVVTLSVVNGSDDPAKGFTGKLVVTTSDGQRFEYPQPVGHPSLYPLKPGELAKDELAHWTSGASGGYAEDVVIKRLSDSELRIRIYGQNVGVGVAPKPEKAEEFTVKTPVGASVTVEGKDWKPVQAPSAPTSSHPPQHKK